LKLPAQNAPSGQQNGKTVEWKVENALEKLHVKFRPPWNMFNIHSDHQSNKQLLRTDSRMSQEIFSLFKPSTYPLE
jgi:hypothetical protein